MCGIVGYSMASGSLDLSEALNAIQHRGPDGTGTFADAERGVGLGHARLAIVDLAVTGHQPMRLDGGKLVLTYNGELYDFNRHRDRLVAEGVTFRGTSDTEVLLAMIERSGWDVLTSLNGIFAFAAFDTETDEVTVVRDGFGIKPLYYCIDDRGVFFASEVRSLMALGCEPEAADPVVVARYLSFLWNPGSETPARNIRKLGPGEAMTIAGGKVIKHWQWFDSPTRRPVPVSRTEDDAIDQTADHLRRAVHRQMVADVPVGAFLSGGLDSSAIVAFAREQAPDIRCFTIETEGGPEPGMPDDLPYATRVADHLGVNLQTVRVDPDTMVGDLEGMIVQLEEPLADPACLNVLYISRRAREQGIKVLLSGAGGDDLFTGYRRHRAIALDQQLASLPHLLRVGLAAMSRNMPQRPAALRRISKFFNGIDLGLDERIINYFVWTPRQDLLNLLAPDARRAVEAVDLTGPLVSYLAQVSPGASPIDRMLALEQRFFLTDHNLTYTDKMSMAASVEVRVPFLDSELVEFASTLPDSIKQRGNVGKWVLKRAMEPYLPHDVIYRPKAGFGAPLRRWINGKMRPVMLDLLSAETIRRRGLFDAAAVQRLIDDDRTGRRDASYTLLSLMCIELWCRHFTAGACARPTMTPDSTYARTAS